MTARLADKVALITGAGSGIGRAAALLFAREGAAVVVSDVTVQAGEETAAAIRAAGGQASFIEANVAEAAAVEALIARTVKIHGRLDCAFNNAGIEGLTALTADCTEENWDRTLATNLKGVWLCLRAELKQMLEQGGGAIVNTASVAGLVGFVGLPAYVASKHGIVGLTKTAALEYAQHGIRVNAICPGVIQTAMIDRLAQRSPQAMAGFNAMEPVGRLGRPEEIAEAALWLCSDAASFVTGAALAVDGGLVAQ